MIDFKKAKEIAIESAKSLIGELQNIELEGILISDNMELYEVSLSYDLENPLELAQESSISANSENSGLSQLAKLMAYRKHYKVFLVDCKTGKFRGFKNQTDI